MGCAAPRRQQQSRAVWELERWRAGAALRHWCARRQSSLRLLRALFRLRMRRLRRALAALCLHAQRARGRREGVLLLTARRVRGDAAEGIREWRLAAAGLALRRHHSLVARRKRHLMVTLFPPLFPLSLLACWRLASLLGCSGCRRVCGGVCKRRSGRL